MFHFFFLLMTFNQGFPITDFMEGTSPSNVQWEKLDSNPFNEIHICNNAQQIGPFIGIIGMNIKKTFTNLQPHYSLQVTLDLIFTEYWSGQSNYVNIFIDSETIYTDSSISTSNFNTPSTYCKTNQFLIFVYNQQLISIRQNINNQNLNPTLEIKSSFQCTLLSLNSVCEKLLVKNVVITPQLCHSTCLTCIGPNEDDCQTCPNGIPVGGKCTCQNDYFSFNYQCIQNCPQYYTTKNQKCILNCSLYCLECKKSKCKTCENGYKLYQGQCVATCPKFSSIQNNHCEDFQEQSIYGSQYLGKYFDSLDIDLNSQIDQFTFIFNPTLSKLTGQIYSTYNNLYLLGGYGVWSDGHYKIVYNGLPAHNYVRIYLTAWFIDNWTNEQFIIKLDNQIIYQGTYQSSKATSNLFYQNSYDYIEDIQLKTIHTQSSAELNFLTTLAVSAYEASLALSNIYILIDNCDNNCLVCSSTQCTLCDNPYQLVNKKCALCDSSNFRNNDCTCYIGFYDDRINQQCQKCKQECETCLDAFTCEQCKLESNLIILPNCMNCNTGFYYNDGICSKCNSSCLSCFGNQSSQCLSCKTNQILNINNECQTCKSNQFLYNNTCQDCQYNCETCEESQKCLTCSQGRVNTPLCNCQQGYYENEYKICQPCNIKCSTCESQRDNCLSCSGNRQHPPFCKCPDGSDQNDIDIWCTDCTIVNLNLKLSSNIKQLTINFGKNIQRINPKCSTIFEESTLQYLGNNPICFVNDSSIVIVFGLNARPYFGMLINFKQNQIKFQECADTLSTFLNNILLNDSILKAPLIIFTNNQILLSACPNTSNSIYQIQNYNFGNSPITFINWKLVRITKQDPKIDQFLENLNNQFNNQVEKVNFEFSNDVLEMENEILLELQYQNVFGIQGSSLITIKKYTEKLLLDLQPQRIKYLVSQLIQISIQVSHCLEAFPNDAKLNISATIGANQKQIEVTFGQIYIYQIEPYVLKADIYQLNFEIFYQGNIVMEDKLQIIIENEEPTLKLISQSNFISFKQQLVIHGNVMNIDQTNPQLKWDCFDLSKYSQCQTANHTQLILPDSQNLTLKPYTLDPFSVYVFSASFQDLQQIIVIKIVEFDVPLIEFQSYPQISNGYINHYDQLLFKFKYLDIIDNPDALLYTGVLSNSNLLIKNFKFNYLELQISLSNYFTLDQLTENMELKINIYNPDYFLPSQLIIPLQINIPPLQCRIDIDQLNASNKANFTIKIMNCQDENYPLQYRLVMYLNQLDLNFDYSTKTIQKGIILIDYQYSNVFNTKLTGNGVIQLMVQVKDTLNGISNYTNSLTIVYEQGVLNQLLLDQSSITQTLIYAASLQFEKNYKLQEIQQIFQRQITYFTSCNCITQKQLLTLKTLSVYYRNLGINEIFSELALQKERLNQINLQMPKQAFNQLDKFEHVVQEFKKITLLEETIEITKYIDELYKVNKEKNQQRRILISEQEFEDKNNNNQIIMESIDLITDIQLSNQVINGNMQTIVTNSFNISTQKVTQKVLENLVSISLTDPQIIGQDELQNIYNPVLEKYSYKMINYQTNPYQYDINFMDVSQTLSEYPLYQPEIKQLSNSILVQNLSTSQGIRYNFENQEENLFLECATKVGDDWNLNTCQTIKENNKTICYCQYISSTTILQATQQIFDDAIDFFSLQTINQMLNCQYQSIIFTYIVIIYTILFVWFLFQGFKMDQNKNEDSVFHSTKVTPTDWDFIIEKAGGIINIGEIDAEKQVPTIDKIVIQKGVQKKQNFSTNDSQITSDDKQLKRPQFEYYNKFLASKKSVGITTNVCSGRMLEEIDVTGSLQSKSSSGHNAQDLQSTNRNQQANQEECLYKRYSSKQISFCKTILSYTEINHKVLSLYYLYDKDCSRVYRTIMLYVSLLGEISILTFFGKIINLNTIIALSILQTLFGVIYRKILQVFLKSQKLCLNYLGFNLALLSVLLFLFTIFGSVAKYPSVLEASLWGAAYISSFILNYLIYTNIQILLFFLIIIKYGDSEIVKKYLKFFMNDKVFIITFGNQ